ncbi:hypothetical protein PIB30_084984 [Stylosanthes scabra]|uniref:Uncharacterized protein n=1 Tax=Stylosanthes scabra TaxID=79078 RepID=A0ABU6YRY2_9FABA|nr:hypothetical protein [Stylosanthes scabra]
MNLDFSFLQSTFDSINGRVNTTPPTLGEQQGISPEQPGSSKSKDLDHANPTVNKNQGPQGEPERDAMNISDSTKRDSTDKLQRMLDAIRIRKDTVQSTSVTQQQGSANSAQSEGNQGQVDNVQLTYEKGSRNRRRYFVSYFGT